MRRLIAISILGLSVVALTGLTGFGQYGQSGKSPVMGAWKVTEIAATGRAPITNPQAGLYIFTEKHYSAVRLNGTRPLPAYPSNDQATDAQKVQGFNTIYVNSGAYTVSGNMLTTMPQVAKSGFAMAPGRMTEYEFSVSGDTLMLTQKSNGNVLKFVRVE